MEVPVHPTEAVAVDLLDDFEGNPNEMSDDEFSALVEEIIEHGWAQPLQVVGPIDGRYKIVGGHHRRRAAQVLEMASVPCVVVPPEEWDEEVREIEVVKQNILHGSLNPEKFTALFNRVAQRHDVEVARRMLGFTKQDAFEKLYLDTKKALPPGMQEKLEEVRNELRTIDDLSLVLNRLFTEYGDTVKFHAMFFSWGGREHLMAQMQAPGSWQRVKRFVEWCVENGRMVDEELMARMDWPA